MIIRPEIPSAAPTCHALCLVLGKVLITLHTVDALPTECPNCPGPGVAHQHLVARPFFSGGGGPQDTPPCFSLPPGDPDRFSQGSHDG